MALPECADKEKKPCDAKPPHFQHFSRKLKSRSASQETEPEDALEEIKAFYRQEKFPAFFLPAAPAQHRTNPFYVAYEREN